ncbi:hypothetical protein BDY19DRAFT_1025591 [Irpex rosettiformis]|uniref:Uncharacterized protein n=1 Tax=Irpex rosettiformis TaxID=378272 RepID=A0ACB8TRS6_9APHY|nr:hypothetical protein BDY19DRAFT_1025591 [Irpex rosettiformis]
MHFFKSLAALATVAFGASSVVAAPLSDVGGVPIPPLPHTPSVPSPPSPPSVPNVPHLPRAGARSIPLILADVTVRVTPLVAELKLITSSNANTDVVGPILDNVKAVLSPAIVEINALVGQPVEVVLASVDGTGQVTVEALAETVSDLTFGGLRVVYNVAPSLQAADLTGLLSDVANIVVSLLGAVLSLVNSLTGSLLPDLIAALVPILGDLVSILSSLGVIGLIQSLGINL